jgi:nicotinamide-nucleotide amidase
MNRLINQNIYVQIFDNSQSTITLKIKSICDNSFNIIDNYGIWFSVEFFNISNDKINNLLKLLHNEFGNDVMFFDEPNKYIIEKLSKNRQYITFAESCTGGLCVSELTKVPGSSKVLNGSIVSYSNHIKNRVLQVSNESLKKDGAVSKTVVSQMLDGVVNLFDSRYAIAISGIAGPGGGSEEKPVGSVIIGITNSHSKNIYMMQFDGDREMVQKKSQLFAIIQMVRLIDKDIRSDKLLDL